MTTKTHTTKSCVICKSSGPTSDLFEGALTRCGDCGFTWTTTFDKEPETLYGAEYFQGTGYVDYFADARQRRFECRQRLGWVMRHQRPTTLLEVGAAGGFFVEATQRAGIAAEGVEISAEASAFAINELRVPVRAANFLTEPITDSYDAVCAFHVLEHVADPHEFVSKMGQATEPGGLVYIEVPNVQAVTIRRLGLAWTGFDIDHHLWHFSAETLMALVESTGLEVVEVYTLFSRHYWRPWRRIRNARSLFVADLASGRTVRVVSPRAGDLLRVVARKSRLS